ncbi:2-pyrone-4,6-dicarboxylate hydrolase [Methylophaga sp. 42_25_T18]|nr:2-pyrone-4,6-dicarboxylate hydrolase [Methylophaga sp. 42_25_T18]
MISIKGVANLINKFQLFDSHFHIIDKTFPLIPNNGYMPEEFTCNDYLEKVNGYDVCGGAIVSGSFQAFDQGYLIAALEKLGPAFVGVTQLPATVSDDEIIQLNECGVRAVRFNLKRGGSEEIAHLSSLAKRVYEIANWHVELYVDASELSGLYDTLIKLPAVSIDHLGLSKSGLKTLLKLVEKGVHVKATGFSRVGFDVKTALNDLYSANPNSLMFGTDLPSTRAPKPYSDNDLLLVVDTFDSEAANRVLSSNAIEFYKPQVC